MWQSGANDILLGRKLLNPVIKNSLGGASSKKVKLKLSKGKMRCTVVLANKIKKLDGDIETIQLFLASEESPAFSSGAAPSPSSSGSWTTFMISASVSFMCANFSS